MTTEEKAKAYDEALEKIKVLQEDWKSTHNRAWIEIEEVFPQLAESEDEKMRKELIFFLKEEIPQCSIKEHADKLKEFVAYLERKKEPKPAEWSEEDGAILNSIIRIITHVDDLAHEPTFAGPKWTHPYTKEIAWLKSIRPHPKQEWSDEDEKIFNNIIEKAKGGHWIEVNEITWLINRFKSLRPSWKPSDEQMNCLCAAVDAAIRKHNESVSGYEPARVLKSLYEDLQKL